MQTDGIWANIFPLGHRKESLAETLQNIPLFHDLSPKELRTLDRVVHVRSYQPGETVFVEGDPGAAMYVIRAGRVDIVLRHKSEQPLILAELGSGDFFGEMALFGDSRSATAITRDRSELIGFFHPDLLEIIGLYPAMGAKISYGLAQTLAHRLRYTNGQLREVWDMRDLHEEPVR